MSKVVWKKLQNYLVVTHWPKQEPGYSVLDLSAEKIHKMKES